MLFLLVDLISIKWKDYTIPRLLVAFQGHVEPGFWAGLGIGRLSEAIFRWMSGHQEQDSMDPFGLVVSVGVGIRFHLDMPGVFE
jgi:hypothetical protein